MPVCSTGVLNADGNMVGVVRMNGLRGLPEMHVEPPPQPVIPEPIMVQRNAGGTYVLLMSSQQSRHGENPCPSLFQSSLERKANDTAISIV